LPCHKMMAAKWQDKKKPVTIQRTVHDHKYLSGHRKTREPVKKPVPVLDCDKGMVGFDRMEQ